jgi:hypothetical protein
VRCGPPRIRQRGERLTTDHSAAVAQIGLGTQHQLQADAAQAGSGDIQRADNIQKAIDAYTAALALLDRDTDSSLWGIATHNLANAYRMRNAPDDIERAIRGYQDALPARERAGEARRWALTQYSLAAAYLNRTEADPLENANNAVRAAESAMEIFTPTNGGADWPKTAGNLGLALLWRFELVVDGDDTDLRRGVQNLEMAVSAADEIGGQYLAVMSAKLASAYLWLADREDDRTLRLEYRTLSTVHLERSGAAAGTTNPISKLAELTIALSYGGLSERDPGEATEQFIARAEALLDGPLALEAPADLTADAASWHELRDRLGRAYLRRLAGDAAVNVARASAHYHALLADLQTGSYSPETWSNGCRGLGDAYRAAGDLTAAAGQYRAALRARTDRPRAVAAEIGRPDPEPQAEVDITDILAALYVVESAARR